MVRNSGGNVSVTVNGQGLNANVRVRARLNNTNRFVTVNRANSGANSTRRVFTVRLPANNTASARNYTIQTSRDGGKTWVNTNPVRRVRVVPNTQFVVTYNANRGTGGRPAPQAVSRGGIVNIRRNTFTRNGFVFTGWNTRADGTGTSFTNRQRDVRVDRNMTLHAQWRRVGRPTNVRISTRTRTSMRVNWNRVSGATGYRIEIATNSRFTDARVINVASGTTQSRNITRLRPGTRYHIRVAAIQADRSRARAFNSQSNWSAVRNTTTLRQ